jgi:hypothetical protein
MRKSQATPTVRLDRRASTHPKPAAKATATTKKKSTKATALSSSKIKSAEIVHSSDEDSDLDAEGEPATSPPAPLGRSPSPIRRHVSSPSNHSHADEANDQDSDGDIPMTGGGLEIEVPDARPQKPRHNALASLGLGSNIGLGSLSRLRSPSAGPVSLASVANSVEGSPNPAFTPGKKRGALDGDVIDFGNLGGRGGDSEDEDAGGYEEDADAEGEEDEVEDRDVEVLDLGPPAAMVQQTVEEDEEDPLYAEMMKGLGGDSSEESEEE